jgi:hypothetical protein
LIEKEIVKSAMISVDCVVKGATVQTPEGISPKEQYQIKIMKAKVITYQTSNGSSINLTPKQVKVLEAAGEWPKNRVGEEYATVCHGLHAGHPDCDSNTLSDLLAIG